MKHLFTREGESALATIIRRRPLLAFDFDGTLAPIVTRPQDARLSTAMATRLSTLGEHLPVAIITGRAVADVRDRLGFVPRYLFGNHGAEDELDPVGSFERTRELNRLRRTLRTRSAEFSAAGILVEDKGQSLALHYRQAPDPDHAAAMIHDMLSEHCAHLRVFAGKMVVNVTAGNAPDKADAVRALLTRSGASCALFAGDDVNDEPVFAAAAPDWLTIRVGQDNAGSKALYFLRDTDEMSLLCDRVMRLLRPFGHTPP